MTPRNLGGRCSLYFHPAKTRPPTRQQKQVAILSDVLKYVDNAVNYAVASAVAAIFAGCGWLVRRVFTNQKQLEQDKAAHQAQFDLIMRELEGRDRLRGEDRERMGRVEADVRDIKVALLGDRK